MSNNKNVVFLFHSTACALYSFIFTVTLLYHLLSMCNYACVIIWGDGGGRHWLVQMEWRQAGWSVCLPPLIFLRIIKSRSSLLALAHLGGARKRAVKRLWCGVVVV